MSIYELAHFDVRTIYHYCPIEAFLSIVKNGELWMSRIQDVMDSKELKWMDQKIMNSVDELAMEEPELEPQCKLIKEFFQEDACYDMPYIVCFSGNKENINQWNSYANHGEGVAIGFSVDRLVEKHGITSTISVLREGYTGHKVVYVTDDMKLKIKEIMREKLKEKDAYYVSFYFSIYTALNDYVKDEKFVKEDEYRILYHPKQILDDIKMKFCCSDNPEIDDRYDFRLKQDNLVPYYRMSIEESISEIIIGKNCSVNIGDIRKLLIKHKQNEFDIEKSNI